MKFAQDTERLRRFQREAKVLASLNHPNIASIYGVQQSDDGDFFSKVIELAELRGAKALHFVARRFGRANSVRTVTVKPFRGGATQPAPIS